MKSFLGRAQLLVLFVAGSILAMIGACIIFAPTAFYASSGINLGGDVSLLNEMKAPAGMLLVAGLFIVSAVVFRRLVVQASLLSAMVYLSYAGSRTVSMLLDGLPALELVQAAIVEAIVGFVCLVILVWQRNQKAEAV